MVDKILYAINNSDILLYLLQPVLLLFISTRKYSNTLIMLLENLPYFDKNQEHWVLDFICHPLGPVIEDSSS
jgi:hypothetical protein